MSAAPAFPRFTVELADGYAIDTDPARLDLAQVHEWLSGDAYWARGRSAATVASAAAHSLNLGVYAPDGRMVGYGRIVSDGATFGWLCDVYIAPEARGHGLGTAIARAAADYARERGLSRLMLATADAHGVYARAGFAVVEQPDMLMLLGGAGASPRR